MKVIIRKIFILFTMMAPVFCLASEIPESFRQSYIEESLVKVFSESEFVVDLNSIKISPYQGKLKSSLLATSTFLIAQEINVYKVEFKAMKKDRSAMFSKVVHLLVLDTSYVLNQSASNESSEEFHFRGRFWDSRYRLTLITCDDQGQCNGRKAPTIDSLGLAPKK